MTTLTMQPNLNISNNNKTMTRRYGLLTDYSKNSCPDLGLDLEIPSSSHRRAGRRRPSSSIKFPSVSSHSTSTEASTHSHSLPPKRPITLERSLSLSRTTSTSSTASSQQHDPSRRGMLQVLDQVSCPKDLMSTSCHHHNDASPLTESQSSTFEVTFSIKRSSTKSTCIMESESSLPELDGSEAGSSSSSIHFQHHSTGSGSANKGQGFNDSSSNLSGSRRDEIMESLRKATSMRDLSSTPMAKCLWDKKSSRSVFINNELSRSRHSQTQACQEQPDFNKGFSNLEDILPSHSHHHSAHTTSSSIRPSPSRARSTRGLPSVAEFPGAIQDDDDTHCSSATSTNSILKDRRKMLHGTRTQLSQPALLLSAHKSHSFRDLMKQQKREAARPTVMRQGSFSTSTSTTSRPRQDSEFAALEALMGKSAANKTKKATPKRSSSLDAPGPRTPRRSGPPPSTSSRRRLPSYQSESFRLADSQQKNSKRRPKRHDSLSQTMHVSSAVSKSGRHSRLTTEALISSQSHHTAAAAAPPNHLLSESLHQDIQAYSGRLGPMFGQ